MFVGAGALLRPARAGDDQRHFERIERLDEVIERTQAHRLDRARNRRIGGHDDDTGVGREDLLPEQIRARAVRQIHIHQREIETEAGFTYAAFPTVTSVSPNSGPTAGGTAVTITGTNFAT